MTRHIIWGDDTVPIAIEKLDDGRWRVCRAGQVLGIFRTKAQAFASLEPTTKQTDRP